VTLPRFRSRASPSNRPVAADAAPPPGPLNEAAFDALVRAQYGKLCGFAHRLVGSDAVAEELVQDVLTAVWAQGPAWTPEDPVAFLWRAVRNRAVSLHRREQVQRRRDAASEPGEATVPSVAEQYDKQELREALARAIWALPERCRTVYTLSREQEMSYSEIAAALGLSIKTVETHMGRALKALRVAVGPYLARVLIVACVAGAGWVVG
jgi:RNA polymerase sigma-70 factor (ECF subfamily)